MNEDLNQIPFESIYWTSTKHLDSSEAGQIKNPVFNSNDLILLTYKVCSLGLIDANISWEWTKQDRLSSL